MDVISEMLGVPEADRDMLRRWPDEVVHRDDGEAGIPPAALAASANLLRYFGELVAERRVERAEGLVEALIEAEIDGEGLGDRNVVSFLFLMIIAGNETTTKLLANALYWISRNPAQRKEVEEDPSLIAGWVEETLRYDNSSQILGRVAAHDLELRGERIREGDRVLLLVGSANRDPDVFPNPDRFDLHRDFSESLSFGKGVHFCLGARLAGLEGLIGLQTALAFFPACEIDTDGPVRVHSSNVRGFSKMPNRFAR